MDLNEAEKSFDYFADLLKMQCTKLTVASDMEVKAASTQMAAQASETRNQVLASLEESCKNSQILSIIVLKEMTKQAEQLICVPLELAKVTAALNRLKQASHQAHLLIEEQEKRQAQKTEPKQPSETAMAIRRFLEKEHTRNRSLPDPDN